MHKRFFLYYYLSVKRGVVTLLFLRICDPHDLDGEIDILCRFYTKLGYPHRFKEGTAYLLKSLLTCPALCLHYIDVIYFSIALFILSTAGLSLAR